MDPLLREDAERDRERSVERDDSADARDSSLGRRLIRSLWPFWQFKDASRGDMYARAAAYRHNRRLRDNLPRYLLKWMIGSGLAWMSVLGFDALAAPIDGKLNVFVLMAAGCGIVFAYAVCVMVVTASAYLYLTHNDR